MSTQLAHAKINQNLEKTNKANYSLFRFNEGFIKKFKHEIDDIRRNMAATFKPISYETEIKLEIIADVIANSVEGILDNNIPEERILALTLEIEEFMKQGEKVVKSKETALTSLNKVNHKIFIPYLPKLSFGKYQYQLRPLFPNLSHDGNPNYDQPYVLIKSHRPKNENNIRESGEFKDCSGCEPRTVEYCRNCGRVLVDGKHPSNENHDDHPGSPPTVHLNLKRELIHLLYTDIYPFIFFTTFVASLFGVRGWWSNPEEKMSFFIGSITNKLLQFRDAVSEEIKNLLGYNKRRN